MTGRRAVRVADLGVWIAVIFADGHIERADTARAPAWFSPLTTWAAPAGGVVHAVKHGLLVHSSGQGHLLGRNGGTPWNIDTDTSIVSLARDRDRVFIVEADGELTIINYDRVTPTRGTTVADGVTSVAAAVGELVAVTDDGTVNIWDAPRIGDPDARTVTVTLDAPAAAADTNGRVTVAVDDDGHLWTWEAGVTDPAPTVVACAAWLRDVSLSTSTVFATDTNGRIWSAPLGALDELAPAGGPVVADAGLWVRALCQWAVDVDSHIWFRGKLPGTAPETATSDWWRLGVYGTERFDLASTMIRASASSDTFDEMFAAADRLTR